MNYCTHCGAALDGAVNFCKNCGAKLDDAGTLGAGAAGGQNTPVVNAAPVADTAPVTDETATSTSSQNPPLADRKKLAFIIGAGVAVAALILVLVFTVFLSKSETERPLTVAELLDLGEKYLLDLDYEQALVQYLAVIEIEPRNERGYTGAAEAYIGLGDRDSAIAVLQSGYERLPGNRVISEKCDTLIDEREAMQSTPTPTPPEPSVTDTPADNTHLYADIISAFMRYEESGWTDLSDVAVADIQRIEEQFSWMRGRSFCYGMADINGDTQPELIIGRRYENSASTDIVSVYTVLVGRVLPVTQLFSSVDLSVSGIELYDDGTLETRESGIRSVDVYRWSITTDFERELVYNYFEFSNLYEVRERGDDAESSRYYYDANGNGLSDAEGQQLVSQYSATPVSLEWHPLNHFFSS